MWENLESPKARLVYWLVSKLNRGVEKFSIEELQRISGADRESIIRWLSMIFTRRGEILTFTYQYSSDILDSYLGKAWYFPGQDITVGWLARFMAINCAQKTTKGKAGAGTMFVSKVFTTRIRKVVDEIRNKERKENLPAVHPVAIRQIMDELLVRLAEFKGCSSLLTKPLSELLHYTPEDNVLFRNYKGRRLPEKDDL